jgi:perosamine synthetase
MIPWAKPTFCGREDEYVREALASTWISGGPFVDRLERDLQSFLAIEFAASAANGTAALHLAYLALGVGSGDEVVVPGFAYQAAANVAILCGARPVFAEVDASSWCLDPKAADAAITSRTKAIAPVHTYGNAADITTLLEVADQRGIAVVEDAAESFGTRWEQQPTGTFGTLGTFSFHATKTIATGEGGALVMRDPDLNAKVRLFRSHGMSREKRYYWHEVPGHNFRLTNLQAAIGCAQLENIELIIEKRQRVHHTYVKELASQPGITLQRFDPRVTPVLWAMAARLDPDAFPQGRDQVIAEMEAAGVECRPGFYAASQQPIYQAAALPICEMLARDVVSLPTFPDLTEEQIQFICRTLLARKR